MLSQNDENLLKEFFIQEGNEILKYNKLSEDKKEMFTKNIVASIVTSIENKAYQLDNREIENSKGDITKLENYRYIIDSLNLLNNMQVSMEDKIPFLDIVNEAHKVILKQTDNFEKGYKTGKDIIKLLYSQVVISLIYSLSFIISSSLDYIKDPQGNYEVSIRYNLTKQNNYPTISIECLNKFNLMDKNGELNHFFVKVFTDKNLQESAFTDGMELIQTAYGILMGGFDAVGRAIFIIARLIPSIPDLLRLGVSMSYYTRVNISDYLKLQAYYVEMNTTRLKNLDKPNKQLIKRQEKIMKELLNLSDKIGIDQKMSSKKAKVQIEKENKNISKTIKEIPSKTAENSSTGIEEIIL